MEVKIVLQIKYDFQFFVFPSDLEDFLLQSFFPVNGFIECPGEFALCSSEDSVVLDEEKHALPLVLFFGCDFPKFIFHLSNFIFIQELYFSVIQKPLLNVLLQQVVQFLY